MTIDEKIEAAERTLQRLEQLPAAIAWSLVTELRTCRRVLREIRMLAARQRAAELPTIHTFAVAALEEPPPTSVPPDEAPAPGAAAAPGRVVASARRRPGSGAIRGQGSLPGVGLLSGA